MKNILFLFILLFSSNTFADALSDAYDHCVETGLGQYASYGDLDVISFETCDVNNIGASYKPWKLVYSNWHEGTVSSCGSIICESLCPDAGTQKRFETCSAWRDIVTPDSSTITIDPSDSPVNTDENGCEWSAGLSAPVDYKSSVVSNDDDTQYKVCSSELYTSMGSKSVGSPPANKFTDGVPTSPPTKTTTTDKTTTTTTVDNGDGSTTKTTTNTTTIKVSGGTSGTSPNLTHDGDKEFVKTETETETTNSDGSTTTSTSTTYSKDEVGDISVDSGTNTGSKDPSTTNSETGTTTVNKDPSGTVTSSSSSAPTGSSGDTAGSSTSGGSGGGGGQCNPKIEYCGDDDDTTFKGEKGEDLYEPTEKTFNEVFQNFADSTSNTQLVSSATNFFQVSVSGSCPVYTLTVPFINYTFTFDNLCKEPMTSILPFIKAILLATASFIAFRIGFL